MILNEVAKQLFNLSDGGHINGKRFTQQELCEHIRRLTQAMEHPQPPWTLRCQTAYGLVRYHGFRNLGEVSMITTYRTAEKYPDYDVEDVQKRCRC